MTDTERLEVLRACVRSKDPLALALELVEILGAESVTIVVETRKGVLQGGAWADVSHRAFCTRVGEAISKALDADGNLAVVPRSKT